MQNQKITAKDIMNTEVISVRDVATLAEAAQTLFDHGISGAPVVDEQGTVVGIVSEADLLSENKRRAALPRSAIFGFLVVPENRIRAAFDEGFALLVRSVMTRKVIWADENASLEHLAHLMVTERINRIPILRDGQLVGIVTREDALRAMSKLYSHE